jgi:hypothetical protein
MATVRKGRDTVGDEVGWALEVGDGLSVGENVGIVPTTNAEKSSLVSGT